jgi:heavy metal sensor kinase
MNRLKTLRVRFALWTAGVLLASSVLFGLFAYASMSYSLATAVDENLQVTALELMSEVEIRNGEPVFIENPIQDPQYTRLREQGFSVRVLNLAGQPVQAYGPYRDLPRLQIDLTIPNQPGEFTTISSPGRRDSVRVFTSPVVKADQMVGLLQVAQNLNEVRATLNLSLMTLLLAGPTLVIVAGSSGYFLAARALAPIDNITRTARHISAKDLSARLNLPETDDEVGRLAATFDSMLARLDDAFRRERQFTADASHELRTPLAAIQTIIGSTLARQRTSAEYEQALIDLSQEAEQMRTLTEGLLQLARNDAARQPAKFECIDVSLMLKDVVDSLRPLAEDKGLKLIDNLPDNDLTLMGDTDGLIRLFVNLLDNAIKYTEQGSVIISAEPKGDTWLAVAISDTGVGIDHGHLPHIFDRFYRVDESRRKDGIGLGLAIAANIAHAHGGEITVESRVGKGTTFFVQLSTICKLPHSW